MKTYQEKILSKKKILQTLTHEIRSPLFNIKSFLETLYEYHFQLTDLQVLEFLEIANQETNRLVRLTNKSFDLSKADYRLPIICRSLIIEDVILQVVKSYEITVLSKRIQFYNKSKVNSPKVNGSYDLLFQVLINLLTNSIKFTYPRGLLLVKSKHICSLSIAERNKICGVRVEVLDTGIGFSKLKTDTLFLGSKKKNKLNNRRYRIGLGLPIVKEILDTHNKSVVVIVSNNKGTDIFFNL